MEILRTTTETPLFAAIAKLSTASELRMAPEEARGALVELICNVYEHARDSAHSAVEWGVDTKLADGAVQFDVWDNGKGFSPSAVFLDDQHDTESVRPKLGRGLGLADLRMLTGVGLIRAVQVSSMGRRVSLSKKGRSQNADRSVTAGTRISLTIDLEHAL